MSKYRFTLYERYAVWSFHKQQCYLDFEPVLWRDAQVDHVIPENMTEKPEELKKLLHDCGLPENFNLNDYCNWMPIHGRCNASKQDSTYFEAPRMVQVLRRLQEVAEKVRAIERRFLEDKSKAGVLTYISSALDTGNIRSDELQAFLAGLAGEGEDADLRPITAALRLHIDTNRWTIAPDVTNGIATVTDGKRYGITPVGAELPPGWICTYCGSAGPWSGRICMNCNRTKCPEDD